MTASPSVDGDTLALFGIEVNGVLRPVSYFGKMQQEDENMENIFCENLKLFPLFMYDLLDNGQYSRVKRKCGCLIRGKT